MSDRPKILDEDEPLEPLLRVFERREAIGVPWMEVVQPGSQRQIYVRLTFRERVADLWDAVRCWITRGRR